MVLVFSQRKYEETFTHEYVVLIASPQEKEGSSLTACGQHHVECQKGEHIPTKVWDEVKMRTFTTAVQHRDRSLNQGNQQDKEIQHIGVEKEELKLSLLAHTHTHTY